MEKIVYDNLKVLWDYLRMDMELRAADCIIGFGCYDDGVALRAAELYRVGYAPKLLFTGGLGRNTREMWTESEAERFARIAVGAGVPAEDVLIEDKSTNTGENIAFSRELLAKRGVDVARIIGVQKPYMERRLFAAIRAYWPEVEVMVTSPRVTVEEHLRNAAKVGMNEERVVNVIVGDFQRVDVYAKRGYQIPQVIPGEAWAAYEELVRLGYTNDLI